MTPTSRVLAACLLVLFVSISAAASPPDVGKPAPPLNVKVLLNAPGGGASSWEERRGRAIVVEFWATWCGPCIKALPHLNTLGDRLRAEPIDFLAITDESEAVVRKFLETRPIHGWVGLDPGRIVGQSYGVSGLPMTVLIDGRGIVRAVTDPEHVTEGVLLALLRGDALEVGLQPTASLLEWKQAAEPGSGEPLFEVLVRPSAGGDAKMQMDGAHIFLVAKTVPEAMADIYGVDSPRIVSDEPLPQGRFDYLVTAAGTRERRMSALREAIEAAFGFTTRREQREMSVLRLVGAPRADGGLLRNDDGNQGFLPGDGRFDASSLSSTDLARLFERLLGTPVVDDTGLPGRYDLHLSWDSGATESFQEALQSATGLTLVPDRRSIEALVVEHIPSAQRR